MQCAIHGIGLADMVMGRINMPELKRCSRCENKITKDNWIQCDSCGAVFCDACIDENMVRQGAGDEFRDLCSACCEDKYD